MATTTDTDYSLRNTYREVDIDSIIPNEINPRRRFAEGPLAELAESIKEHGVLEPLLVRELDPLLVRELEVERYEIIAGERRYRASQLAGLRTLPVRVLDIADDAEFLKIMLLENLQREDLDPIEEAEGFAQLNRVCGLKQAQIAAAVHRSQGAIANRMRLLKLPEDVRELITAGELTPAHGVALARFDGFPAVQSKLAKLAISNRARVADLESGIPWQWELERFNTIKRLGMYYELFDSKEVCPQCPHNAYRGDSEAISARWCLRSDCYDDLQAQAEAEQRVKAKEVLAKAAAEGVAVPKLADLPSSSYRHFDGRKPKDCRTDCPNRRSAITGFGGTTEVCTDPPCLARLRAADTRAENKQKREDHARLKGVVAKRIDALEEIGPREWTLLARVVFAQANSQVQDAVKKRHKIEGKGLEYGYNERSALGELTKLDVLTLAKALVESVLLHDLRSKYEGYGDHGRADWYLGAEEEPAGE